MSGQRSYWFRVPLIKQLKRDSVGHGEVTINNARLILAVVVTDSVVVGSISRASSVFLMRYHDNLPG